MDPTWNQSRIVFAITVSNNTLNNSVLKVSIMDGCAGSKHTARDEFRVDRSIAIWMMLMTSDGASAPETAVDAVGIILGCTWNSVEFA